MLLAYAIGTEKPRSNAAEGAFQLYTVVREDLAAPIPDDMPFADAAVLPLGLSTAASALFGDLGLSPATGPADGVVLVWGAASSVGGNAVPLAVAAGYDVVATASPRNHDFVRGLGARAVLDRRGGPGAVLAALDGAPLAGALAVGNDSARPCADVVARSSGSRRLVMTSPPVPLDGLPPGVLDPQRWSRLLRLVGSTVALQVRCRVRGSGRHSCGGAR